MVRCRRRTHAGGEQPRHRPGNLPRGARVRVKLSEIDLMALDVRGTVTAHLDTEAVLGVEAEASEEEDEDSLPAGPVTIAVDLNDSTPSHDA